ncbi:SIS domain-containing protein [Cohnella sp. CFH 77786]|uniref:SIS domain-containing protein n=1 Tax=Cohnella sp. CFH 77786 TaxID=2662265 RepID=UPI001C60ED46|nr:SIS domain-containing protein [Cohnella sp. CFH 77786]MBW5445582.1 SIS domain-containing protein [Cohnella sp. CFH 77786]
MAAYGTLTYPEIAGQHEAWAAARQQLEQQRDWIEDHLRDGGYDETIFIGSGSSYYQAQIMAATFRSWLGRKAYAYPSSDILLFRGHSSTPGRKLLVGVSRSGESSEVVLAIRSVMDLPDWTVCGITCYPNSSMARLAPCLVSPLGAERSTVMTKSFSSMTFLMQAAIALASGSTGLLEQMDEALTLGASLVPAADALAKQIVDGHDLFRNYIYLGMGPLFGIAQEACLKIKEMANVWTESFGTLEFRHGPKSIIEPGSLVVLILSEQARAYELKVAEEMKAYGAKVLVAASETGEDTAIADFAFVTGGRALSDDARAALTLPLLQFIGYYTALKRNVNPDEPRNLTQVVKIQ